MSTFRIGLTQLLKDGNREHKIVSQESLPLQSSDLVKELFLGEWCVCRDLVPSMKLLTDIVESEMYVHPFHMKIAFT